MGYDSIEEIQKQTHEWAFIKELPETIGVFKKKITDYIEGQVLFICRYEAPELRASVDLTYSAETFDYILVRTMGLNSFRDVRLIYKERDVFEEKTKKYLPLVISNMEHPEQVNLGELYEAKKVEDWEFGKTLPKKIGSFELYGMVSSKAPASARTGAKAFHKAPNASPISSTAPNNAEKVSFRFCDAVSLSFSLEVNLAKESVSS